MSASCDSGSLDAPAGASTLTPPGARLNMAPDAPGGASARKEVRRPAHFSDGIKAPDGALISDRCAPLAVVPTDEMIATQVEIDAAAREDARDLAEALSLLELCRREHDTRRSAMDRAATRLACSLEELDAARRAAEEAGQLVLDAMRLVSLRRGER